MQSLSQNSNNLRFDPTLQIFFYNVQSNINLKKLIWNWRADWQYYQSLQNLCENSIFVHRIVQYIFWIHGWKCVFTNLEKRTCSFRNSAFLINDWFQFLLRQFKSCNSNKKGSLYNSAPLLYRFWNFVILLHFSSCKICHMKKWNVNIFFFNINVSSFHRFFLLPFSTINYCIPVYELYFRIKDTEMIH